MSFIHDKKLIMNNSELLFSQNLFFYNEFDQTYIEDNTQLVSLLQETDNIDKLSDVDKKNLFSKIGLLDELVEKNGFSEERKMQINAERLAKVMKFINRNYDFEKAKKQLINCMAFIKISRDFVCSNAEDRFIKSSKVTDYYFSKYDYPFTWMSSNSLYSSYYPVVYKTYCMREHCILLAWRLVFICLKKVSLVINLYSNISEFVGNSDDYVSEMSNQKKYAMIKKYLLFAYILLNQIIPAQMIQMSGNLKNQSKTIGAMIIPELNPYVVETYNRITLMMFQKCFFIQCLSYFTSKTMKESSENIVKCMVFNLNNKSFDIDKEDDTYIGDLNHKTVYVEAIDLFIDMCYDNEDVICILGSIFNLCYLSFIEMNERTWSYHISYPFADIINYKKDKNDMLPSKDSVFFSEKIKKHFKCKNERKKNDAMINLYKRLIPAMNCYNYLLGTCIYIECLLSCYEISKIDMENDIAMPYFVNLCNKVELLFLPQFDRKECGFEIMAWIIEKVKKRQFTCAKIDAFCSKSNNEETLNIGLNSSYIWKFVKRQRSVISPLTTNFKKIISSIFTINVSNGKKIDLGDVKKTLEENKFKNKSDDEENDSDDDQDYKRASSSSSILEENISILKKQKNKKINIPFDHDDLILWSILIGHYPDVNNTKTKKFANIETNSFSVLPAKIFIPKSNSESSFCNEYQQMLLSIIHNVKDKSIKLKGK